jgi:cytochrome d ubiquinol oxidase subunit I
MDWLDPLFLSRIQFAMTIMFHYLFPPLTIGLGAVMLGTELAWLRTGDAIWESAARFWTRIFAVNFAMGVATGIVMEFEFGTNWAAYSRYVGDVFGSALAAEGIFAFFLESGFLGVLVFGWDRVSKGVHAFATAMVFLGGLFSSIWIVIANSWMHTPSGYHIVDTPLGPRAEITDFWAMVFNPSAVTRLWHVWSGSFILGGAFVTSISAWYLLRGRHGIFARRSYIVGLVVLSLGTASAFLSGHSSGEIVGEYQPAKLAAFEGHYETGPAPLWLFGVPDDDAGTVRYGLAVPGGLSLLMHLDPSHPVEGLAETPREDWPNTAIVFQTYHGMLVVGVFFAGLCIVSWGCLGMRALPRPLLWAAVIGPLPAHAGNQLGWMSAEMGRQPWIVYGLMRTDDGVSKTIHGAEVMASILMFGSIYALLFVVWVFVMNRKIQHGPDLPDGAGPTGGLLDAAAARANPADRLLSSDEEA